MIQTVLHLVLSLALLGDSVPAVRGGTREEQVRELRARYAIAEDELGCRDLSELTPEQRAERARLLGILHIYRVRGEFGVNTRFAGARMPYFVDDSGRRCAVAELLHVSGEDALVEDVREQDNHAWIADLAGDARFEAWLARSGFSIEEVARIQSPPINYDSCPPGYVDEDEEYGEDGDRPSGPTSTPSAAGASGGSGLSGGTSKTGGAGTAAVNPGASTLGAQRSGAPSTLSLTTVLDDEWWLWWEHNKSEFLRPNRLGLWSINASGDDVVTAFVKFLDSMRSSLAASLAGERDDEDASVRAATADALGRIAGPLAVPQLVRMLADPNVDVRHHAILALGASGSAEAVLPLLSIMRSGSLDGAKDARISPVAAPLAIVALALGRRSGFDERIDQEVARRAASREKREREAIGTAALIYQMIAPCADLEKFAFDMAQDSSEAPSVRCRAIESLRSSRDPKVLGKLAHFLSGPRMDERRSAALALGGIDNALALPSLRTAFELEPEPLTRGFILVSIGRQGGDEAREYLLRAIETCDSNMRHWCALALGLVARKDADPAIRAAIRSAAGREKSRDAIGAYWIAAGLARDEKARPMLRDALFHTGDARQRMYAATSLALIGGEASLAVLRERMLTEESSLCRVALAQSLGILGDPRDAKAMLEMLVKFKEPMLQGLAASAIAFHGSREALMGLSEIARMKSGSSVRRAAAIEGLGMMLGTSPPLRLADASRQANYTVFSDWVRDLFQVAL